MKNSRRRFLKLLAAGSAAVATRHVAALAAPAGATPPRRARRPAHPAPPSAPTAALRAEIERQQRDLAKTLQTLRDYPLEPGSDPAFVLAPMRAERKS